MVARKKSLSQRSVRVLRAATARPVWGRAICPDLAAVSGGTIGSLYQALATLSARGLVRWDAGGINLRVTRAGFDLLATAYYRDRP